MAKYPSFNLWTDAYLADTHPALTLEEHGAYLLLLMFMWRAPRQRIPNDDEWIARNLAIPVEDVKKLVRPLIQEKCICDGNFITQKRLKIEWEAAEKRHKKASVSAKARYSKEINSSQALLGAGSKNNPSIDLGTATTTTTTTIDKKESKVSRARARSWEAAEKRHKKASVSAKARYSKEINSSQALLGAGSKNNPSIDLGTATTTITTAIDKKESKVSRARARSTGPKVKNSIVKADWRPSEAGRKYAIEKGITPRRVDGQVERFIDHYRAKGERRADWQAAWKIWCRIAIEKKKAGKGAGSENMRRLEALDGGGP